MVNPFKYDYGRFMVVGLPKMYECSAVVHYSWSKYGLECAWDVLQELNGPFEQMELVEILDQTTPLTRKLRNAIRWYEDRVARR